MAPGGYAVDNVPSAAIAGLRRSFLHASRAHLDDQAVFDHPTMALGGRVLVVDEVSVSGDTLRIAASLIRRAFPETEVSVAHWMTPRPAGRGVNKYNNQLPVWYRDDTSLGRLVGDRDPIAAQASASWRTRSGAWFYSLRHPAPDADGIVLRREVVQLFGDVLLGRVPLVPGFDRDEDWAMGLTGCTWGELLEWRVAKDVHLQP